ncbi:hypothetical protein L6164_019945 [Bauhinia variegata]|uniref:Uncharacterized protein n=1 Tax=Bauhinia variegata TaxID=167791 RepID=A0ACB9MTG2_BAUVA|nr:hypothetical protein L6164_019945 [Bauhinia variegata]
MAEMLLEAAVGAVVGELLKAILETKDRAIKFRPTLERLEDKLRRLEPLIKQIAEYDRRLDRPKEEMEGLIKQMEECKKLVLKCAEINWWQCCFRPHYQEELDELDNSLDKLLSSDLQVQIARDQRENLLEIREMRMDIKKLNVGIVGKGPCSAPDPPEFTVGLDIPLKELKLKLKLFESGVSVLVLTGLAGSGKTTLTKMLCSDEQVKGKFRENIFFVTFSKSANITTIVQKFFQHITKRVPVIQDGEDALNQLEILLKSIEKSPILLVLDDVWPESESLVDNFMLSRMSDHKILVTSRFAIKRFGPPHVLKSLGDDDAMKLFRYWASLKENSFDIPDDLAREIVRGCSNSPLVLKVIGKSLCQQHPVVWQSQAKKLSRGHSILDSSTYLLECLWKSFDVSDPEAIIKECFMDLGLFPEDQRIPAATLVDMWAELYDEDADDLNAMEKIYQLANRNVVDIVVTSKVARDLGNYYNDHFVIQHDLLRELAIHKSSQEPESQRNRLIIDISGNNLPKWWAARQDYIIAAHTLSISTDEVFNLDWCNMQAPQVEVLVLNLKAKKYTLPKFMDSMSKLKVVVITNYGFYPSDLENFELLGSLPDLKRIRLEHVSIPSLGRASVQLQNLRKLSLFMCNMNKTFENCTFQVSNMLPKLEELALDYCNIVELPAGFTDIVCLKKLCITNCHKFSALPEGIGKLVNLESLRLSCCSDIEDLPDSIRSLGKLNFLDISDCISLSKLPEHIGEVCNLETLYVRGCSRLSELPPSIKALEQLRRVVCDEDTAILWEPFKTILGGLRIEVPKVDINLNWLHNHY